MSEHTTTGKPAAAGRPGANANVNVNANANANASANARSTATKAKDLNIPNDLALVDGQLIPMVDLQALHAPIEKDMLAQIQRVVKSGGYVGGDALTAFETAFGTYCQAPACVGVGNGTDALALSLRAVGVAPGDTVLVPAMTFVGTAEAVSMVGATPRPVDIDSQTYTLDPDVLQGYAAPTVKAVIPVHLYGQAADMRPIMQIAKERGWAVIEDAAQAHGARYHSRSVGTWGDLAAFSFYPTKNLGGLGDGGAVVGQDRALVERVRCLANHGRMTAGSPVGASGGAQTAVAGGQASTAHQSWGINSRLDAVQAAALKVKLAHLDTWNERRCELAALYHQGLKDIPGVRLPALGQLRTHVYYLYTVLVPERDRLRDLLRKHGIQTAVHYPLPWFMQPAYAHLREPKERCPVAWEVSQKCLSLPMHPTLSNAQVERVVSVIAQFMRAGAGGGVAPSDVPASVATDALP